MALRTSKIRSPLRGVDIELASATAYWWKKSDFVTGLQRRAPGGEFLVAGGYQGAAEASELRPARNEAGEKLLDARTGSELDEFLRSAGNFLEAAEEENLYLDGRRYAAHRGIVTRSAASRLARAAVPAAGHTLGPGLPGLTAQGGVSSVIVASFVTGAVGTPEGGVKLTENA